MDGIWGTETVDREEGPSECRGNLANIKKLLKEYPEIAQNSRFLSAIGEASRIAANIARVSRTRSVKRLSPSKTKS